MSYKEFVVILVFLGSLWGALGLESISSLVCLNFWLEIRKVKSFLPNLNFMFVYNLLNQNTRARSTNHANAQWSNIYEYCSKIRKKSLKFRTYLLNLANSFVFILLQIRIEKGI